MPAPPDATVLLGGALSHLGLATARAFSRRDPGIHLVLPVHDAARGQRLRTTLRLESANTRVSLPPLELTSLGSIEAGIREIRAGLAAEPLDALVLHANLRLPREGEGTDDGIEWTWAVQHVALGALLLGLLPLLKPTGRLVLVVYRAPTAADHIPPAMQRPHQRYAEAAAAAARLCLALDRRLRARGGPQPRLHVYDCGLLPERARSAEYPRSLQFLGQLVRPMRRLLAPRAESADEAGEHLAALALGHAWADTSGLWHAQGDAREPDAALADPAAGERAWRDLHTLLQRLHPSLAALVREGEGALPPSA